MQKIQRSTPPFASHRAIPQQQPAQAALKILGTRTLQERALEILQFKLDVLWALADAIMLSQCEIEIRGAKT